MLTSLNIPPGVVANGTEYSSAGRWRDSNLVRWYERTIRPVGGWKKMSPTQLPGPGTGVLPWRQNSAAVRVAIGCPDNLMIYSGGALFDITPVGLAAGREDAFVGYGFGYGAYGVNNWGESATPSGTLLPTTWSFDTWGENLVACASTDGKIYEWTTNVANPAVQVANSPEDCSGLVVTPERILIALGADGIPNQLKWCASEDNTDWTPTATNSAGSMLLQDPSSILLARRVRGQTVILTETELHALKYVGQPFIYSIEKVGSFCGGVSAKCAEVTDVGMAWMGRGSFFLFDGTVRPVPCDVSDRVFGDINLRQISKVAAGHNSKFGEVWWFYPSSDSLTNDKYVIWNYREGHWAVGSLPRSAWHDSGVLPYPVGIGVDKYVYEHESGWTAAGVEIGDDRYVSSGPVEISDGNAISHIKQIVPDENTLGDVRFSLRLKFTPTGSETELGPLTAANYTDVRATGRQASVDVYGHSDSDWRLGPIRLDISPGGKR